jgi:hypothetical protein
MEKGRSFHSSMKNRVHGDRGATPVEGEGRSIDEHVVQTFRLLFSRARAGARRRR